MFVTGPRGDSSQVDDQALDLVGSHYSIGRAQGQRTEQFHVPPWWPPPPPLAFALDCARQVAEIHAPLLDELRGYAEAQELPYEDLLRGVCRRSMRTRVPPPSRATARAPYPEGGCSSFAVVDAAGHTRAGRNYDFHPIQRVRQRLRVQPDVGRPSVGTRGSVPGGRYDGVNDAGLFVSLHVSLSDESPTPQPGIPFHWLPRLVLETCASTPEAIDRLTHVRHLHPFNYLLADSAGRLAVVEAHACATRVLEPGLQFAAVTNHYRHPDLARYQHGRKLAHSQARLDCLYAQRGALCAASGAEAQARVRATLADHSAGLCGHSGGHTTLWSLTADLSAGQIEYARGAPCQARYEPVEWPGIKL